MGIEMKYEASAGLITGYFGAGHFGFGHFGNLEQNIAQYFVKYYNIST